MESSRETEISLLKELLKWTKFSGMQQLREILKSTLPDENARIAYQLSDGTKGLRDVGVIKKDKLAKMWKNWAKLGLGEFVSVKGGGERFERSFDLEEVGIEVEFPDSKRSEFKTEGGKADESGSLNAFSLDNQLTGSPESQ